MCGMEKPLGKFDILNYFVIAVFLCFGNETIGQNNSFSTGLELALPVGDFSDIGANFGGGVSAEYENKLTDKVTILLNAGVIFYDADPYEMEVTEIDPNEDNFPFEIDNIILEQNITQVPIQLGGRYYINEVFEGFFVGINMGVHITNVTFDDYEFGGSQIEGSSDADMHFSAAPQIGYYLSDKFSVALRYQLIFVTGEDEIETTLLDPLTLERTTATITLDETINSYLGLRAAYHF